MSNYDNTTIDMFSTDDHGVMTALIRNGFKAMASVGNTYRPIQLSSAFMMARSTPFGELTGVHTFILNNGMAASCSGFVPMGFVAPLSLDETDGTVRVEKDRIGFYIDSGDANDIWQLRNDFNMKFRDVARIFALTTYTPPVYSSV